MIKDRLLGLALTIILIVGWGAAVEAKPTLRFHNGELRVVQFTDTHWTPQSERCAITEKTIKDIIAAEHPDVAVVSGDVVTAQPAADGWRSIIRIFEDEHMPFVVLMGNHDGQEMDKDSIYAMLTASPYYVGERGPVNITGAGNCVIPVFASSGNSRVPAALLYCIDSNDYQPVKEYGEYDWIHFDEIEWYRQMSDYYTHMNGGRPIPALAFFHIPLQEMSIIDESKQYLGIRGESVNAAARNTGMFAAFLDKQDVMCILNGHDHNSSYIGILQGIAMGYGRSTGADAYGDYPLGGRMVVMHEGRKAFDTWITTASGREDTLYYPSGITSKDEREMDYLPALKDVKPRKEGVGYEYFEGKFTSVADLKNAKPQKKGWLKSLTIDNAAVEDHFGYVFRALINIPERGVYNFYTYSDDGSQLLIDDRLVVDNDGGHSARRADGRVALEKGWHRITIPYFENYMGQTLMIGYSSRMIEETSEIKLMSE